MYITQLITVTVTCDPSEFFKADKKSIVLAKLKATYENKCKNSMLITDILEIVEMSNYYTPKDRSDGTADIDVTFKARGICFSSGEILQNCKIFVKDEHFIYAKHPNAQIYINCDITPFRDIIRNERLIPISIIGMPRYRIGESKITMLGQPYIPTIDNITRLSFITEGLTPDQDKKLSDFFQILSDELKEHKSISTKDQYKFFTSMTRSTYNENWSFDKWDLTEEFKLEKKTFDLDEIRKIKSGVLVYPPAESKINGNFYHSTVTAADVDFKLIEKYSCAKAPLYDIISSYMNSYLIFLTNLRTFTNTYATVNSFAEMRDYWSRCMSVFKKAT
jgi:hypothetical protein